MGTAARIRDYIAGHEITPHSILGDIITLIRDTQDVPHNH